MMRTVALMIAGVALLAVPGGAQLLWGDDFENLGGTGSPSGPYAPGAVPSFPITTGAPPFSANPINGAWSVWWENPHVAGAISNTIALGTKSLQIAGPGVFGSGCAVVQEFWWATAVGGNPGSYNHMAFGANAWPGNAPALPAGLLGTWQIACQTYHPSSFPTGTQSSYFIVNDIYFNFFPGLTQWIMQVQFDHVTGTVADDLRRIPVSVPIVYDAWVPLVATFDLDSSCASVHYNGNLIGTGPLFVPAWNPGTGPRQIANLCCCTGSATMYYDNLTLSAFVTPALALYQTNSLQLTTMQGLAASVNSTYGTPFCAAVAAVSAGAPVTITLQSATPVAWDAILDVGAAAPIGAGGIQLPGTGQILNVALPGPMGTSLWLFGGLAPAFAGLLYGGPLTVFNFAAPPGPLQFVVQFWALDALHPDGFSSSQPCGVIVN